MLRGASIVCLAGCVTRDIGRMFGWLCYEGYRSYVWLVMLRGVSVVCLAGYVGRVLHVIRSIHSFHISGN